VLVIPLIVLATLAVVAGFVNLPDTGVLSWVPESVALRFEHYVQPTGAAYFPAVGVAEFNITIALIATPLALLGIGLAYAYWFQGRFHGLTERVRLARAGYVLLENRYYFDHLYTGVIAKGFAEPIARASYWVNQNIIDAVLNGAGAATKAIGDFAYNRIDQGVVDGLVNASGAASEGTGQLLRRIQTGKVQQYGALLFGGAAVLAAILIFAF
jgi:NADH-quinone oxidoreductase subunit L